MFKFIQVKIKQMVLLNLLWQSYIIFKPEKNECDWVFLWVQMYIKVFFIYT